MTLFESNPHKLREHQEEAVFETLKAIDEGENPLVIMATGTGKTIVSAEINRALISANKKTLFLAHTEELVNQAINKFYQQAEIDAGKEKAEYSAHHGHKCVVGSVQTMKGKRLEKWAKGQFDVITTDEAHHSLASTYKKIYSHFDNAQLIGLTATPDRRKKKENLGSIYSKISYEYPLHKAIKDCYLSPIVGEKINDFTIDLNDIKISHGDFNENALAGKIEKYLLPIGKAIVEKTADKKTLIFCPNVASSNMMAKVLRELGLDAEYLYGGHDKIERPEILYRFSSGQTSHLCSCSILTEGYDEPSIEAIVMLRFTTSRSLYSQMIGRGTRLYPGKESLYLLEFTANSDTHELVTPYELFSTMGFGERVRNKALSVSKDGPIDFLSVLEESNEDVYLIKNIIDRTVVEDFGYTKFDPVGIGDFFNVDITGEFDVYYQGRKLEGQITQKQAQLLNRYGITITGDMDKAKASRLIDSLFQAKIFPSDGEATRSQQVFLQRHGYDIQGMKKGQATLLISMLKGASDESRNRTAV